MIEEEESEIGEKQVAIFKRDAKDGISSSSSSQLGWNNICLQLEDMSKSQNYFLEAQSIEKPLKSEREYFLCNEIFVEFNQLDEDGSFTQFREMQKRFRPMQYVINDKKIGFVFVGLEQTQRGLANFEFIIKQLESLGNSNYFQLAKGLREYQNQMTLLRYSPSLQIRKENETLNAQTFLKFRHQELPQILKSLNKRGFHCYHLMQCVDDITDAVCAEFGLSDRLVRLLGSDPDQYQQLLLRQGWFDPTQFGSRNQSALEFIKIISSLLKSNLNTETSISISEQITIITLDGIKINAKVQPQVFFCHAEHFEPLFPQNKAILGYAYVLTIVVDEEAACMLIDAKNKNMKREDLSYQNPKTSFQHFKYNCSSECFANFISKHTPSKHHNCYQSKQFKTCNFKLI